MVLGFVALFFAGAFLANSLPHLVMGITGRRHMTPFARSSSAVVNILWAATNVAVGSLLLWVGLQREAEGWAQALVTGIGALLTSLYLARLWSNPNARLPWHQQ